MDPNLSSTISLPELLVLLLAIVGLGAAWYNIAGARHDARIQRESGVNGYKKRLVRWSIREEALRMLALALFGAAAAVSMTVEPRVEPDDAFKAGLIFWAILFIEVLAVFGTFAAAYDRIRIKHDWDEEAAKTQALAERLEVAEASVKATDDAYTAAHAPWDGVTERRAAPLTCPHCGQDLPINPDRDTSPLAIDPERD